MSYKIGFTDSPFPLVGGSGHAHRAYTVKCRGVDISIDVSQCEYEMLNDREPIRFKGVITNRPNISNRLYAGGFGSHSHHDVAKALEEAVGLYCEDMGLQIGTVLNNWPNFRALIGKKQ